MTPPLARRRLAAALAVACAVVYLWMLFAWETAWGVDLKHRDSPPWLVGTFWELQWAVACAALVLCIRRRRRRSYRSASDVELKDAGDAGAAAELVFATVGARPDLGDILRRANEELGADADVLIGGPQRLIDGLEDRLKGRVVERMTWAM